MGIELIVFLMIFVVGLCLAGLILGLLGAAPSAILMSRPTLLIVGALTGIVAIWPALLTVTYLVYGVADLQYLGDIHTPHIFAYFISVTGLTAMASCGLSTLVGYVRNRRRIGRDTLAAYQPEPKPAD